MRQLVPSALAGTIVTLMLVLGPQGSPTEALPAEAANCSYADTHARGDISRPRADRALRCLISNEREARGLNRLDSSERLNEAAQRHTADMHRREYFSHISPGGRDVVDRVRAYSSYIDGSDSWEIGETLATRVGKNATPEQILSILMNSSSHRETLFTSRFRHIGVGWTLGDPSGDDDGATVAVVVGDR
ncbi:MAG: CAP domain-containing protein [Solirubrobacteraceae bacterium MAG38_C4-C5]|nr:CAP domain-containing protein [Candidatus Siliceabacter maunaloa]